MSDRGWDNNGILLSFGFTRTLNSSFPFRPSESVAVSTIFALPLPISLILRISLFIPAFIIEESLPPRDFAIGNKVAETIIPAPNAKRNLTEDTFVRSSESPEITPSRAV